MRKNYYPLITLSALAIVTTLPLISCVRSDSSLTGASAEEIDSGAKGIDANATPEYDKLYTQSGETKLTRVALFFSLDNDGTSIPNSFESYETDPMMDSLYLTATNGQDHGAIAYASVKKWLYDERTQKGFL